MAFRERAIANRLCTAAQRQRDHATHKERLVHNTPAVDDQPPKTYYLHINRAKKEQVTDEQCDKIDRENRLLLKKMGEIIQSHTLDVVHTSYKHSLNEGIRRREMRKIAEENNAILGRLTERKAHYDREEWSAHRERHGAYLSNIREKPIPATPIPPPKFLRDGSMTQRPAHAYVSGNYSVAKMRQAQTQALDANGSYTSGSQSARGPTSSSPYQYQSSHHHTPNRTGQSKTGGTQPKLQPILKGQGASSQQSTPRVPIGGGGTRALASSNSGINKMLESQALKAGMTPILQTGRNLGEAYVILAVHEVPGKDNEEKQNDQPTAASTPSFLSSLSSTPAGHALMFRCYDPLESEDRSISVPFHLLSTLPEVASNPSLVRDTNLRPDLATLLLDRLSLENDGQELRFRLVGDAAQSGKQSQQSSTGNLHAGQTQPPPSNTTNHSFSSPVLPTTTKEPIAPPPDPIVSRATHAVAYTDSTGIDYYFDEANGGEYRPFPEEPATPAATQGFLQQGQQNGQYSLPVQ